MKRPANNSTTYADEMKRPRPRLYEESEEEDDDDDTRPDVDGYEAAPPEAAATVPFSPQVPSRGASATEARQCNDLGQPGNPPPLLRCRRCLRFRHMQRACPCVFSRKTGHCVLRAPVLVGGGPLRHPLDHPLPPSVSGDANREARRVRRAAPDARRAPPEGARGARSGARAREVGTGAILCVCAACAAVARAQRAAHQRCRRRVLTHSLCGPLSAGGGTPVGLSPLLQKDRSRRPQVGLSARSGDFRRTPVVPLQSRFRRSRPEAAAGRGRGRLGCGGGALSEGAAWAGGKGSRVAAPRQRSPQRRGTASLDQTQSDGRGRWREPTADAAAEAAAAAAEAAAAQAADPCPLHGLCVRRTRDASSGRCSPDEHRGDVRRPPSPRGPPHAVRGAGAACVRGQSRLQHDPGPQIPHGKPPPALAFSLTSLDSESMAQASDLATAFQTTCCRFLVALLPAFACRRARRASGACSSTGATTTMTTTI